MNFNKMLDLKGINFLILAGAMALNLFWTLTLATVLSYVFLQGAQPDGGALVQALLVLGSFLGPFLIGWMSGRLAADGRGPTYGIYGSAGSVMVLVFTALPGGILGMMLIFAALAGGLNGGLMSLRS